MGRGHSATHGRRVYGSAGGVASDGTNPFVTTGNTYDTGGTWSGGEAVIRFQPGPIFSGNSSDYWVPLPIGRAARPGRPEIWAAAVRLLVDVPGATPSVSSSNWAKMAYAYLLNRDNLGGITAPVASAREALSYIYAGRGRLPNQPKHVCCFVALAPTTLKTFRITATSPPGHRRSDGTVSRDASGCGSPLVTSTDGTNNMIVWVVGTGSDNTGSMATSDYMVTTEILVLVVYGGGGANELMAGTHTLEHYRHCCPRAHLRCRGITKCMLSSCREERRHLHLLLGQLYTLADANLDSTATYAYTNCNNDTNSYGDTYSNANSKPT